MQTLTRRETLALLLAAPAAVRSLGEGSTEWVTLFDGKSLTGWKASGSPDASKVDNGEIAVRGSARMLYTGPTLDADFKNFEFSADAKLQPGARSGICFHANNHSTTEFAVMLANNWRAPDGMIGRTHTGSLIGFRNVYKQLVPDDEWFRIAIEVRQKQVQVRLNDMLVVDYVEPDQPFQVNPDTRRVLSHGTFAIQAYGAENAAFFRDIRVHPSSDNVNQFSDERPQVDEVYREIIRLGAEDYPVVDYHVHLKGGLTLEQTLANSRRLGIGYGIAINCGLGFPVHDDASVREYLNSMKNQPCYVALQGEGREWPTLVSPESVAQFDYVFTDAMTFRDDTGKRMHIWIPEEIGVIGDSQAFMEMYVKRIEGVMREPIDIYANATYLPDQIADDYNALWTPERMQRVIDAALKNDVAIEINNRRRIPSPAFIKRAKAAGCKFSFGTNNAEAELGRLEYPIQMVRECGLAWQDIFVPRPDGQKPIQLRK